MGDNIEAVVRGGLSLWQIKQNQKVAKQRWADIAFFQYGTIPAGIVVSKNVYRLILVLMLGRGIMASGNWLDIGVVLEYNAALDDDFMMVKDIKEEALEFLVGGDIVGINYDNLKKIVSQKGKA